MNLGDSLFHARRKQGLSQEAVAEQLGVSRQTVSKWEANETLPDIRQSKLMAKLYHTSLDELIEFDPDVQELQEWIAHTPDSVTAGWIGDDTGAHSLGDIYGGTVPAEIWRDYMSSATSDESGGDFSAPSGMERRKETASSNKSSSRSDAREEPKKKSATSEKPTTKENSKQQTQQPAKQQADRNNKE